MPAKEIEHSDLEPKQARSICILAGGGALALDIIDKFLRKKELSVFVIGLEGSVCKDALRDKGVSENNLAFVRPEKVGKILNILEAHGIQDLIMIGKISRPNVLSLRPDFTAIQILFSNLKAYCFEGDDTLLRIFKSVFASHGITLRAVHHYFPDLLAPVGLLCGRLPEGIEETLRKGWQASKQHGEADLGQSICISRDGQHILKEDRKGTDALIEKAGKQRTLFAEGMLVKTFKPQQDETLDVPTIGVKTVENAYKAGFSGIVVEAGKTMLHDRERVLEKADEYGLFVVGLSALSDLECLS